MASINSASLLESAAMFYVHTFKSIQKPGHTALIVSMFAKMQHTTPTNNNSNKLQDGLQHPSIDMHASATSTTCCVLDLQNIIRSLAGTRQHLWKFHRDIVVTRSV